MTEIKNPNNQNTAEVKNDIKYDFNNKSTSNKAPTKKKKLSKPALILILGLVIIAIPCLLFAGILIKGELQKHSPRNGSRFRNDLDPKITTSEVSELTGQLEQLSSVESVSIALEQGQLRVLIDVSDSLTSEQVDEVLTKAYATINNKLPVLTYFTSTDSKRMYDLQINAYTTLESSTGREYKLLHKNAAEETYAIEDMAHPKDAKLAAELEGLEPETTDVIDEDNSDVDSSEQ